MIYIIEILNSSFFYFEFIQKRDASYLYSIAYSLESMLLLKSLENYSCLHLKIQRTYLTVEDIVSKKKKKFKQFKSVWRAKFNSKVTSINYFNDLIVRKRNEIIIVSKWINVVHFDK